MINEALVQIVAQIVTALCILFIFALIITVVAQESVKVFRLVFQRRK